MEKQAPYLTKTENQYRPWVERGETELQYYKRLFLEVTTENAELERDLDEARRLFDAVADAAFRMIQEEYLLMQAIYRLQGKNHETHP